MSAQSKRATRHDDVAAGRRDLDLIRNETSAGCREFDWAETTRVKPDHLPEGMKSHVANSHHVVDCRRVLDLAMRRGMELLGGNRQDNANAARR
jgi:hypothetical protein